jgi:hypothetical protein
MGSDPSYKVRVRCSTRDLQPWSGLNILAREDRQGREANPLGAVRLKPSLAPPIAKLAKVDERAGAQRYYTRAPECRAHHVRVSGRPCLSVDNFWGLRPNAGKDRGDIYERLRPRILRVVAALARRARGSPVWVLSAAAIFFPA